MFETRHASDRYHLRLHRARSVILSPQELVEIRAAQRTFEGAYIRTSLGQFSFSLVVLKIFTAEFYSIVYGAGVLAVSAFRRMQGNRQFFSEIGEDGLSRKRFRTSGNVVVLLTSLSVAAYICLLVLTLRLMSMKMTKSFQVKTHRFPGQHIRQYPGATRHFEEDILELEAKQYIPLSNPHPKPGDITILATHAVSFPKELYEPLWDDLLSHTNHGETADIAFRIRSIWVVDASNQGASGVLNEQVQGDDPSFFDLPRDLLHMINVHRSEFPQPIFGIGHSMGGTTLIQLSYLHPRLLAGLVLFDPVLGMSTPRSFASLFYMSSTRPDLWENREDAEAMSAWLFKTWDSRVLKLWNEHGLRGMPTLAYPEPNKITLTTPKAQEAWIYGRNWFDPLSVDGGGGGGGYATVAARTKYPDLHPGVRETHPFYRPEDLYVWNALPSLRPRTLYICPDSVPLSNPKAHQEKLERTGSGLGGNGGIKEGNVSACTVQGTGHLLPFEKPVECAGLAAEWLGSEVRSWRERSRFEREHRDNKSDAMVRLSGKWMQEAEAFFRRSKTVAKPNI
ncbi:toxin biosynthesis protein-like protein [Hortaea werneckii]|nr:toxin biosynthesis protein-like protein [Hortaea werneckii]